MIARTRLLLNPEGYALFAVRNDTEETYVSRSGTQIAAPRGWWEERLGAFYWVECVEEKRFFGFNCLPMP